MEDFFHNLHGLPWTHGVAEFWKSFLDEFRNWREHLEMVARTQRQHATPLTNSWWACRVCDVMRNYDLALSRHVEVADQTPSPSAIDDLPFAVPEHHEPSCEADGAASPLLESDSDQCGNADEVDAIDETDTRGSSIY